MEFDMGKQAKLRRDRRGQRAAFSFDLDKFLDLYSKVAPATIYANYTANCCLNATRILMDVGEAFGIEVKPVAVKVTMCNAVYVRAMEAGVFDAERLNEAGAYSVVVDGTGKDKGNRWDGHLVGMVGQLLVDSSARQFRRPAHGILSPDIALLPTTSTFAEGKNASGMLPEGGIAIYTQIFNESYRDISGFQRSDHNMDMARVIILGMDALLPPGWRARSLPKVKGA